MNNNKIISSNASIFLDILRLCSALTVLYVHAYLQWFPSFFYSSTNFSNAAHASVIAFFVLSGYVIAYTTSSNNRGSLQYAKSRLSRLYSVLFPALLVSAIIEIIVSQINPVLSIEYSRGLSWPRYLLSGCFLNEIWFFSAAPPINEPLWSLSFEFWYYTIFGFWFYRKQGFKALLIPCFVCLIAGPKILLMLPIWLGGVWAYRLNWNSLHPRFIWPLVLIFLGLFIAAAVYLPAYPKQLGAPPFYFANQFFTDWILGIFIAASLWLLPLQANRFDQKNWIKGFRKFADLTFPIYVLNQPLLILFRALFNYHENDKFQFYVTITIVFSMSVILGIFFDKQRPLWDKFFKWIFSLNFTFYKSIF